MKLPKLPHHPEVHTYTWTALELEALAVYGKACAEAMREACALVVEKDISQGNPLTAYQHQYNQTVLSTAAAIRALEIEE